MQWDHFKGISQGVSPLKTNISPFPWTVPAHLDICLAGLKTDILKDVGTPMTLAVLAQNSQDVERI